MPPKSGAAQQTLRYGFLGASLGFMGLPLYVNLPQYYFATLGISLSSLGALMLFTRLLDCGLDPFIGLLGDRYSKHRKSILFVASLFLICGVFGLFALPLFQVSHSLIWAGVFLSLTYISYSVINISYYSQASHLSSDYNQGLKLAGARENCTLVGVLLATLLPQVLRNWFPETETYIILWGVFCALLLIGLRANSALFTLKSAHQRILKLKDLLKIRSLRWLYSIYFFNALAPAITSTVFLFYVSDVLQLNDSWIFLILYFLAAIVSIPFWTWYSSKIGKKKTLLQAIVIAIVAFSTTYFMGPQDAIGFGCVCLISGGALGADLILLPNLLSDTIHDRGSIGGGEFGIWAFITKFTLAFGAGIALPTLDCFGYIPGSGEGIEILKITYGVVPSSIKAIALILLYLSPLDKKDLL